MGEGENRLNEPSADQLAEQVERSRERLDTLVAELDQRRHILVRLKQMLSEHRVVAAGAAALVLGVVGLAVPLVVRHRRRQRTFRARLARLSRAFGRMLENPDQVARNEPNLPAKLLTTAATTLTGTLVKRASVPARRR
jgi:hypothetical protein